MHITPCKPHSPWSFIMMLWIPRTGWSVKPPAERFMRRACYTVLYIFWYSIPRGNCFFKSGLWAKMKAQAIGILQRQGIWMQVRSIGPALIENLWRSSGFPETCSFLWSLPQARKPIGSMSKAIYARPTIKSLSTLLRSVKAGFGRYPTLKSVFTRIRANSPQHSIYFLIAI